jgi:two-component system sensor histidine kinase BarA
MNKISLKDWVILLTIVPTTVISLTIAGYFSYGRYLELNEFLTIRSKSIIEPIAIASVTSIIHKDRVKLRQLISFAHRNNSNIVKSIAVFTTDNQVLVTSAYHGDNYLMRLKKRDNIPQHTSTELLNDYFIFRTPIINENQNDNGQIIIGYVAMQIDKSTVNYSQQSQMIVAFTIAILGSLISALLSIILIKNITRPLGAMVQAVDRIREGKLDSRISGQLIGELNFLKNGINAMAQSLGDYHNEMQRSIDHATIDLRESLEQFEIQNVELDISKRKAQDANRVKSEFLANMSHELRTPLNGVIGFTRQVLKTPLSETQRDYLQIIERSANNLLAIINDILDFSKLDAGKIIIENIPFTLRESIEEILTLLTPSCQQRNIELSLRIPPHVPDLLIGDAMRIKQVMINLVNNAIKFTDKGLVTIDIEGENIDQHRASFKIKVTDTGIGMNKEQQETIFEAFSQADKSVTRLYGGTGLGLVICQRLANEMKGDIGFNSTEAQGSTFWFSFQCEINPIPIETILNTKELVRKSILYYEPLTHSRIATSEIMMGWKMRVTPVHSLEKLSSALTHNKNFDFALIGHSVNPTQINDLKELISEIKPHIPAIHLAINSNAPNLQEALLASGALSCLSKPITPSRLSRVLQNGSAQVSYDEPLPRVPIKVLVVDDNETNLKLIEALLLEQVMEVTTASHGKEAVEYCKNEMFALIFMDIQMPVMDGVTALKMIKANTFNDKTPMVAVTALALKGEKEKLLQEGFNGYITKPINETMLRHNIYEYCDLKLFTPSMASYYKGNQIVEETGFVIDDAVTIKGQSTKIIDWPLALKRTGNRADLAKDMLEGLVKSLPSTKQEVFDALTCQDLGQIKTLIHKLNGACCYTGVPSLGKISQHIEIQLKLNYSLDDLEPDFFEFFEHLDNVLAQAPKFL